jgi:hypothetical protein
MNFLKMNFQPAIITALCLLLATSTPLWAKPTLPSKGTASPEHTQPQGNGPTKTINKENSQPKKLRPSTTLRKKPDDAIALAVISSNTPPPPPPPPATTVWALPADFFELAPGNHVCPPQWNALQDIEAHARALFGIEIQRQRSAANGNGFADLQQALAETGAILKHIAFLIDNGYPIANAERILFKQTPMIKIPGDTSSAFLIIELLWLALDQPYHPVATTLKKIFNQIIRSMEPSLILETIASRIKIRKLKIKILIFNGLSAYFQQIPQGHLYLNPSTYGPLIITSTGLVPVYQPPPIQLPPFVNPPLPAANPIVNTQELLNLLTEEENPPTQATGTGPQDAIDLTEDNDNAIDLTAGNLNNNTTASAGEGLDWLSSLSGEWIDFESLFPN